NRRRESAAVPPSTRDGIDLVLVSTPRARPERYALSLHDALPIWTRAGLVETGDRCRADRRAECFRRTAGRAGNILPADRLDIDRSEEHTSELQSRFDLVCRLLLEKKKGHHAVEVRRGLEVFRVVEVEARRAVDDSAADRRQLLAHRHLAHHSRVLHALDGHVQVAY